VGPALAANGVAATGSATRTAAVDDNGDGAAPAAVFGGGAEDNETSVNRLLDKAGALHGTRETLSLAAHPQVTRLTQVQKSSVLRRLARAPALRKLCLDSLALDGMNGEALAELMRGSRALQTLSLERNALDEAALVALAAALSGHPTLERLSLGHQRLAISRLAATALIDAMDCTPGAPSPPIRLLTRMCRVGLTPRSLDRLAPPAARQGERPGAAPEAAVDLPRSQEAR
jgi:hypothetical protein